MHITLLCHEALWMQARVMSLLNDAVATLAACRYTDPDAMLGVILGTGVNGAYVEQPHNVQNAGRPLAHDTHVIIDCEWGDFVSPLLPMSGADKDLDAASDNPGCQHYEKMTAGETLPRIVNGADPERCAHAYKQALHITYKGSCMLARGRLAP